MEQTELKEEVAVSKQQRSRGGMKLDNQDHERELNMKGIDTELSSVSHKNEERKVTEAEIAYLTSQFLIPRHRATNLLRKLDLKQAVKSLIQS